MTGFADPRSLIQAALTKAGIDSVLVLTDPTRQAPYVHVVHVGGEQGTFDRMDTFRIDVVTRLEEGEGLTSAHALVETITAALSGLDYHDTAAGYIDRIDLDQITTPAPTPLFPGPFATATVTGRAWHRPQH